MANDVSTTETPQFTEGRTERRTNNRIGNSEEPNASAPARCRRSSGEGEAVHGLRVLGIALVGAAQIVESPQAALLLAEDGAQILEGHGIPAAWVCMVYSLACGRSPARW